MRLRTLRQPKRSFERRCEAHKRWVAKLLCLSAFAGLESLTPNDLAAPLLPMYRRDRQTPGASHALSHRIPFHSLLLGSTRAQRELIRMKWNVENSAKAAMSIRQ